MPVTQGSTPLSPFLQHNSTLRSWAARALTLGTLALLLSGAGCAQVPTEALNTYSEAYSEAREAGRRVYAAAGPAFVAADTPQADIEPAAGPSGQASSLFPEKLDRRIRNSETLDPAIQARLAALDAVAIYNEVLMELASGASAEQVQSGVGQFAEAATTLASLAGAVVPGGGAIVEVAKNLVGLAEQARAASETRRALLEGAPLVAQILQELDQDVDRLYAVQRAFYQEQISGGVAFALDDASNAVLRFASRHVYPGDGELARGRNDLDRRFETAWQGVDGPPPSAMLADVSGDSGAAPYDRDVHETLKALTGALEAASAYYWTEIGVWQDYQAALRDYAVLLATTAEAHRAAVAAAQTPASSQEEFYRLLTIAGEVRANAVRVIESLNS